MKNLPASAAGAAASGTAPAGPAAPDPTAEPRLCDFLRAKVSAGAHGDKRALFAIRDDASSIYWCLLTMSPSGPDDGLVHADRCSPDRTCCTAVAPEV